MESGGYGIERKILIERDEEERGKMSVLGDTISNQSPMVPREELLKRTKSIRKPLSLEMEKTKRDREGEKGEGVPANPWALWLGKQQVLPKSESTRVPKDVEIPLIF
jgi:hypothetical protein